jgi:hypothetical protein
MKRAITIALAVALAAGTLVGFVGPVAAETAIPDIAMQVDELGPLLELLVELFDVSVSIEG